MSTRLGSFDKVIGCEGVERNLGRGDNDELEKDCTFGVLVTEGLKKEEQTFESGREREVLCSFWQGDLHFTMESIS